MVRENCLNRARYRSTIVDTNVYVPTQSTENVREKAIE